MRSTISSAARTRLALVAFASVWLAACGGGGGGGGDGAAAPAPLASGSGSPGASPAPAGGTPAPAAGPAAFQAWGPTIVDTNVAPESSTSVARLGSGGSVVAWVKDAALQAQLFDAAGARVGTPLRIAAGGLVDARTFSLAPLANGEWIATWAAAQAGGPTLLFQRFTAAGQAIGAPAPASGAQAAIVGPVARATADGGFVIGWSALGSDLQQSLTAFVARFAADGSSLGGPVAVSADAADQGAVHVVPLASGTVLVTWRQGNSGYLRPFDSSGQPSGPARQIVALTASAFTSAPLANDRIAVAWGTGTAVNWQVLDASGAPLSNAGSASTTNGGEMNRVAVVDAGDGGFHVLYQSAEQSPRSNTSTILVQRVNADGAADGPAEAIARRRIVGLLPADGSPAPQAGSDFSASGGPDGHYVLSYEVSADTSVELHAQAK